MYVYMYMYMYLYMYIYIYIYIYLKNWCKTNGKKLVFNKRMGHDIHTNTSCHANACAMAHI